PWVLGDEDLVPFLWNSIATPVGLIVPIGGTFLAFLIGFGLLEFVGVLMQPIMRPLWTTPGRSAIDAVASFVGSYSLGILVTDRVYQKGGYTGREAAVIATGFSTVSAAFMVIVAKQLDLMNIWGTYFAATLVVT
ncbi:YjiH family protein, partial [Streptococcus pneumoniae]|nr:YjiH family protein [Streptococcus pneumoniae]